MSNQDLAGFRQETRAWLEENCPPLMRTPIYSDSDECWGGKKWKFSSDDQRIWLQRMASRGWTAPGWPKEYGGGGLTEEQCDILSEELGRINARVPLTSMGIKMLGPALMKYGTEEQKRRFLPDIVRGNIRWCQGYSEPNAGSDLAALQARAEDRGDHYLVNGSKVWTSYSDQSDWIFCLVRTDVDVPKHKGISFLLFDMESSGVSTKPIRLISGSSPFCETFFDNVSVPKENLVGEENKGWEIAKFLLGFERQYQGSWGREDPGLGRRAVELIGRNTIGNLADELLRADIVAFDIDQSAFSIYCDRLADEGKAGRETDASTSIVKYYGTELNKNRYELTMAIEGTAALDWGADGKGILSRNWLRSKGNSIEGGTSEIQLNIIAKRILGLPD